MQQVHGRAAEHDDDALPERELVEDAVLVARRDRLGRGVAGVLHEHVEEAGRVHLGLAAQRARLRQRGPRRRRADRPRRCRARARRAGGPRGRRRGLDLAGREHAGHRDVAAERDRLDAVLGLAELARPERRAEADHVLADLDAEQLGRDEVARSRAARSTARDRRR